MQRKEIGALEKNFVPPIAPDEVIPQKDAAGYYVQAGDKVPPIGHVLVVWGLEAIPLTLIAWGLVWENGWGWSTGVVFYGSLLLAAGVATLLIATGKWSLTIAAVSHLIIERTRIHAQRDVLLSKMESDASVALAESDQRGATERYRIDSTVHAARVADAQVVEASKPQSHSNQLASFVSPDPDPFEDVLRKDLLKFFVDLYDDNAPGKITGKGRIINCKTPWSARGSLEESDKNRALDMLNQLNMVSSSWALREQKNAWYINIDEYPTPGKLVKLFAHVRTPK